MVTKKTTPFYAEAIPAYEAPEQQEQKETIGSLVVTKLVHQHVPIHASRDGGTFGSLVDAHIQQCLDDGEDLHEIILDIDPKQWAKMKADFHR